MAEAGHEDLEAEEGHLVESGPGADLVVSGALEAERAALGLDADADADAAGAAAAGHALGRTGRGRPRLRRVQRLEDDRQREADVRLADPRSICRLADQIEKKQKTKEKRSPSRFRPINFYFYPEKLDVT